MKSVMLRLTSVDTRQFEDDRTLNDGHGGVLLYVKNYLNYIRRNDLESKNIEAIWLELCFSYRKPILVAWIYRVPNEKTQMV